MLCSVALSADFFAAAVDADRCASFDQADRLSALVGVVEELGAELVGLDGVVVALLVGHGLLVMREATGAQLGREGRRHHVLVDVLGLLELLLALAARVEPRRPRRGALVPGRQ